MPLVSKPISFACRAERLAVVDEDAVGEVGVVIFDLDVEDAPNHV